MWTKWVMLSTVAATTCLLRGTVGSVTATPGGSQTAIAILGEAAAIAAANGYTQESGFLKEHTARLTEPGSGLTASMYRDLTKGLPVEVDHVLGDLLARGVSHGVAAPLLTAAFVQVSIYSHSLSR
jgi:2-dehydropantoate 2-reductase